MLRNMSSACDDMDVTLAQLHMVPEMVSLGGGARLCKHAAQEPSCPGTPTQPREAPPTPAHYGYDAPSPVGDEAGGCSCSSYSASVPSTASSSPASSTAAAAAAAGHIASLSNSLGTATAAEAHCAAGADLAADLELRGSGRGGAAAAIRPGEYHQSDAAVSLRHVLARQRRMAVAAVAAAAPQQPHAAVQCDNPEQQTPEQQLAERFRRERQELLQQQHQNRSVVVSWMAEVSTAFRLSSATLSLAVELYDCYMAKQTKPVPNSMLQLLALTCLKVACSMEEVERQYTVQDWAALALDRVRGVLLYDEAMFGRMECMLLETLGWRTLQPTKYGILQHLLHAAQTDPWVAQQCGVPDGASSASGSNVLGGDGGSGMAALKAISEFLAELTLPCRELQRFQHSTVSVACFAMALWILSSGATGDAADGADGTMDVGEEPAAAAAAGGGEGAAAAAAAVAAAAAAAGPVVAALAAAAGVDEQVLAPCLRQCFEILEYVYGSAMFWVVRRISHGDDGPPPEWLSEAVINRHGGVVQALLAGSPMAAA